MMLVYPDINLKIKLKEDNVFTLVVENQSLLYELLTDLNNQINGYDGKFVLSEKYEPIAIGKNVELISQMVPFSINQKDLLSKLYTKIKKQSLDAEMYEKTHEIIMLMEKYIAELAESCSNEIVSEECSDITPLLKMFGIKFYDEQQTLTEKLIDFMTAVITYKGERLFITVNLRSYISDNEAKDFFRNVILQKMKLICIESTDREKLPYEEKAIIDNDLCII